MVFPPLNNLFLNLLRNASWHMHAIYYIYTFCVKLSRLFLPLELPPVVFFKEKITLISSVFHGLSIHPKTKTLPLHHPVKNLRMTEFHLGFHARDHILDRKKPFFLRDHTVKCNLEQNVSQFLAEILAVASAFR